jgi:hypothetical protein
LVKHLLDHGCAANSKIEAVVYPSGKLLRHRTPSLSEEMTATIWTLVNQEPTVGEEVVLELLQRGKYGKSQLKANCAVESCF